MENNLLYAFIMMGVISLVFLFKNKLNKTSIDDNIFSSYGKVKSGYQVLLNTLYYDGNKKDFELTLQNIFLKNTDGRYVGGYTKESNELDFTSFVLDSWYELTRYFDKKEESFILELNKNVDVYTLKSFFENSLTDKLKDKDFFSRHIERDFFPYQNVLFLYQKELNENAIQIGFFNDYSASNYLFIFPISKENIVKKAISDIGFEYQRVSINIKEK